LRPPSFLASSRWRAIAATESGGLFRLGLVDGRPGGGVDHCVTIADGCGTGGGVVLAVQRRQRCQPPLTGTSVVAVGKVELGPAHGHAQGLV